MTTTEIAGIVAKLTKAQIALIIENPRTASDSYRPALRLQSLGLADWRPGRYGDTFYLTMLGLAVRAALQEAGDGA